VRGEEKMPTKIEDVTIYSDPEVSNRLNVKTVSIRHYIKQGYLNGQKVMGRWVVVEEELEDFFKKLS
jgi:predicted site-specific integrase-resolvase